MNFPVIFGTRCKHSNTLTTNRDTIGTHPFHQVGDHRLRADARRPHDEAVLAPLLLPAPLIGEANVGGGDLGDACPRVHTHVVARKLLGCKLTDALVEPERGGRRD